MEVFISISSLLIALTALCFTVWQTKLTRQHNKISVKPHLTTWSNEDFDNKTYVVNLMNNGIGPALIKSFSILVDNKVISGNGTEPTEKAIKILFPNRKYHSHNAYMNKGFSFGAKESCKIIAIKFSPETQINEAQIEHAFNRADIVIEYESFYGDSFKYDTREEKPNIQE